MTKKKFIISESIFISLSIAILLGSYFPIKNNQEKNSINNLNNYISLIDNMYSNDNEDVSKIESSFKDLSNYRISLISYKDGSVIYDNYTNYNKDENRLEEFIKHQDSKPYYKVSLTTNLNTLYIVKRCTNSYNFIRLGIAKNEVFRFSNIYLIVASSTILLINILVALLNIYQYKKSKKYAKSLSNLNSLIKYDGDDLNVLYSKLNDQLSTYSKEIEKNNYILDNMKQGFIILDSSLNVVNINEYSKKIFIKQNENESNILYFENGELIEKELKDFNEDSKTFELKINNKWYEFLASKTVSNSTSFIVLIILDITSNKEIEISKRQFFQNASHELKSPLTTIIGYEELIEKNILKNKDDIKHANEVILKESLRMKNIVLDMLSLASLESNISKPIESLNLKEVILDIEEKYQLNLNNKNINVSNNLNDYQITINKEDIYRLVNNIFINAINYNVDKGMIFITLKDNVLSIKDTGIGISESDQQHVFERFFRTDKSRSKESNGTGLGLAIVKHICINNNIKIELKSHLNKGSEFIFTFKK